MYDTSSPLHTALDRYERRHREDPQGRFFLPLATTYRRLGELERAESLLRTGLRYHPDYLSAHVDLGLTLAARGAADEAGAAFRRVLRADPQNLIALRSMAELAAAAGHSDDAAYWYSELLAVDPMSGDDAAAAPPTADVSAPAMEDRQGDGGVTDDFADAAESVGQNQGVWDAVDAEPLWKADAHPDEALPTHIDARDGADGGVSDSRSPDSEVRDSEVSLNEFRDITGLDSRAPEHEFKDIGGLDREVVDDESAGEELDADDGLLPLLWEPEPAAARRVGTVPEPGVQEPETAVEAAPGTDADADELASQTLAELYARQGFTGEAAEMYRALIRQRGAQPALVQRLAELEGHVEAEPGRKVEASDSYPVPEGMDDVAPAVTKMDAFAASFVEGFAGAAALSEPALSDLDQTPQHRDAAPEAAAGTDLPALAVEQVSVASDLLPTVDAPVEQERAELATITGYFGHLLGWRPEGGNGPISDAEPAATPTSAAEPAPEAAPADAVVTALDPAAEELKSFQLWLRSLKQ